MLRILTDHHHDPDTVIHRATARMCHFGIEKPWRRYLGLYP